MKIAFVTDVYNHHQSDLADFFSNVAVSDFSYIVTKDLSVERLKMGWTLSAVPDYVVNYWHNKNKCDQIIMESDILIFGAINYSIVKKRIDSNKITFCYSERPFKNIVCRFQYPLRMIKYLFEGGSKKNLYFLAASAFAPIDYNFCFCFLNRCYKWGYFPPKKEYDDINELISNKINHSIVWVGRFIKWKHPEIAIDVIDRLVSAGHTEFCLKMIGVGPTKETIMDLIKKRGLDRYVSIRGPLSPSLVREEMEKAQFFLFTSDYNEGWGAVINESMNSCCIPIASHSGGAVPYLINNQENGVVYKSGDAKRAAEEIARISRDEELRRNLAKNAYYTIINTWNGAKAGERLISLYESIKATEKPNVSNGPCSVAKIIKNGWFRYHENH